MNKHILIAISTIITLALIWFLWWAFSPLLYDTVVNEALPPITTLTEDTNSTTETTEQAVALIRSGQFAGYDALHDGSGTVNLFKQGDTHFVRFESDFSVTNGPDLYVSLAKNGVYSDDGVLALLKGNKGSQNYEIPAEMNPDEYDSVYIWCKAFSVPFAKAKLM